MTHPNRGGWFDLRSFARTAPIRPACFLLRIAAICTASIVAALNAQSAFGQTSPAAQTSPATTSPATTSPTTAPSKSRYEAVAMTRPGDAARGKALFFNDSKIACSRCHSIDGKGGKAGPDLFAIGDKFGRKELCESILSPSATIAVGYSTTLVKTRSGEVIEGIVKEENAAGVGLMGADGKLVHIDSAQIAQRRTTDVSLMPENLQTGLTPPEFADLIEFLTTLRAPESAALARAGMPSDIPMLARPAALRPVHSPAQKFAHPVWFGALPGMKDVFAVEEHESGKIWLLDKTGGRESRSLFLDSGKFQAGTRGLIGLVFHPGYARNRRYFYVRHLVDAGHFTSNLFEGKAAPDLQRDSGRPPRRILTIDDTSNVHYGGGLAFGPDGCLYLGMGDSGPQGDPNGNAQNLGVLLGKMSRIDVDSREGERPYSIPKDNPFIGRPNVRPEIWAYGFREPWRFSFDPLTGDLWAGDVGQDLYEEVDLVRRGENYGWNVFEGFEPFSNRYKREGERFIPPLFAYTRKYGASVTGGHVYRADPASSFYGVYIFADYQNFRLFGLTQKNGVLKKVRQIGKPPEHPVSLGIDDRGELYVVGYEGTIYHIDLSQAVFE